MSAALAAACGGSHSDSQNGGQDAGYGVYKLALVGSPVLTVHPQDKRTLQVIFAQDQIGGVANASVHFDFEDGDPASAVLDNANVTTDADGAATIKLTAGNNTKGFKLVASVPQHPEAKPVAFSVSVVPVRRLLQIVGSPQIVVAQAGDSARVTMYTSSTLALKVREMDADTGTPIANDTLSYSLPSSSASVFSAGGSTARQATAVTNAGGEAQVFLISSANTESNIIATAGTSAQGSLGAVSFNITVQNGGGATCSTGNDCPGGQICVGGHCQTGGGGGQCGPGTDQNCPFGYTCVNGICEPPTQIACTPGTNSCQPGQTCQCTNPNDPSTCGCVDLCNPACGPGTTCKCTDPNNPATCGCIPNPAGSPDVTGVWYTQHSFDISQALPTVLKDIFKAIRYLDQAIVGKLDLPPWLSWLNPLIAKILQQYIPPVVQTIIRIGDDIGTILSMLRSQGAMNLKNGADAAHVKGSEVWTSLIFYWLPLCGDNIGGDPDVPPACARFDIATTDSDNPGEPPACKGQSIPAISVQVGAITAAVTGSASAGWTLAVDERKVNLEMGKVVLIAINELLTLTTQWHCIDEATDCNDGPCIVDCPGLGQWVDGWASGFGSVVEGICDEVVTVAGQAISQQLANITFTTKTLDFNGSSSVSVANSDPSTCLSNTNCASQLGHDDFDVKLKKDVNHRDGLWTGSFFSVIKGMPGAWEGTRTQPQ